MILIFEKKEIGRLLKKIGEGREEEKLGDRLLDLESYDKKEKLLSRSCISKNHYNRAEIQRKIQSY